MKDFSYLFYPGDALRDTQFFSCAQKAAYIDILTSHIENLSFSYDLLMKITRNLSDLEKKEFMGIFEENEAGFYVPWMQEAIIKRQAYLESRSSNKKGKIKDKNKEERLKSYDNHMENKNKNTVLNTDKESIENLIEPESPRVFLEQRAFTRLDAIGSKSGLAEGFEFALMQWNLSCIEKGFKFDPNDEAGDIRKLLAGLEKWLNSWLKNEENRKSAKNYKPEQQKPTFKRITQQ